MSKLVMLEELTKEIGVRPLELLKFAREPRELDYHLYNPNYSRDVCVLREMEAVARKANMPGYNLAKKLGLDIHGISNIEGGSFVRGTSVEVLYSSHKVGTQLNTFTTEASLMGGLPECAIPALYFYDAKDIGKTLTVKAKGRNGATGTPTFTWTIRLNTTSAYAQGSGVAVSTAAWTVAAVTLAPWELEVDITCQLLAQGATGLTLALIGSVRAGLLIGTNGGVLSFPTSNTAFTVTLDHSVTQYLYLSIACGTSNASNLSQLEAMKVYGEN